MNQNVTKFIDDPDFLPISPNLGSALYLQGLD